MRVLTLNLGSDSSNRTRKATDVSGITRETFSQNKNTTRGMEEIRVSEVKRSRAPSLGHTLQGSPCWMPEATGALAPQVCSSESLDEGGMCQGCPGSAERTDTEMSQLLNW